MRQRSLLIIGMAVLLMELCIVAGAQSDEVEWLDAQEYTLYWGDEINHSGYLIKAGDFSPSKAFDVDTDYVMLSISSVHHDSWGAILAVNNSQISNSTEFDDRLNITAIEVVTGNDIPSPYTTISVAVSNSTGTLPVTVKWIDATLGSEERNSDEIYIDERAHFSLELKNLRDIRLGSVNVKKFIHPEFVLDPDNTIKWNLSFDPYEKKTIEYSLRALKPGTFEFNGTLLTVEHEGMIYSRELNASNLVVHGPFINVSKNISHDIVGLGDEVNITVNVVNEGDRAAHVKVSDQLPVGAVLLQGDTADSRVLHANNSLSLVYSVRMDKAGDIVIPSACVDFIDSKEYEGTVYSRKKVVNVRGSHEVPAKDLYDEGMTSDKVPEKEYTGNTSDYPDVNSSIHDVASESEDHGKLQFLYDIFGSLTGFLKDTKDKIL